jgi:hypothetical protein
LHNAWFVLTKVREYLFVFLKFLHIFDPTNQIFLPFKGCLIFIKKGGEIRLCEALATNPELFGERCQNLIPEKPGDDKNKTRENERVSSDTQQFYHAAHAYVHAPVRFLISEISKYSFAGSDHSIIRIIIPVCMIIIND